jgi:hypothetical protein
MLVRPRTVVKLPTESLLMFARAVERAANEEIPIEGSRLETPSGSWGCRRVCAETTLEKPVSNFHHCYQDHGHKDQGQEEAGLLADQRLQKIDSGEADFAGENDNAEGK